MKFFLVCLFILVVLSLSYAAGCQLIEAAGSYSMDAAGTGAGITITHLSSTACVAISASDIVFNCSGYSIDAAGAAGTTIGILINNTATNVTVQNCPGISNYTYGVYFSSAENSTLENTTASNNSDANVYLTASSNNTIRNVTTYNSTYGFQLASGSGNNTLENNSASENSIHGFYAYYVVGNNLTGNIAWNNTQNGIAIVFSNGTFVKDNTGRNSNSENGTGILNWGSNHGTFIGNIVHDNVRGFRTSIASSNNTFLGTVTYNNSDYGFYVSGESNSTLRNNLAYNNTNNGFQFDYEANLTIENNTAFQNGLYGFRVSYGTGVGSFSNLTAYANSGGLSISNLLGITLTNITAYNCSTGVGTNNVSSMLFENSVIYNNSATGVDLAAVFHSILNRITIENTSAVGLGITGCNNISVANFTTNNSGTWGYYAQTVHNSRFENGQAINNILKNCLYLFDGSENNTVTNFTCSGAGEGGIHFYIGKNNSLFNAISEYSPHSAVRVLNSTGVSVENITTRYSRDGLQAWDSNVTFSNITAYTTNSTFYLVNSNATVDHLHAYNHTRLYDVSFYASISTILNMTGAIIDNPRGGYENYTNISIHDLTNPLSSIRISWTNNSVGAPPGVSSFNQKYVKFVISVVWGGNRYDNNSFDYIAWHWQNSELAGYDENELYLWKYTVNGSEWSLVENQTLDTASNMINVTSLQYSYFNYTYGIFYGDDLPIITIQYPNESLNLSFNTSVPLNYTVIDYISGVNTSSCRYFLDGGAAVAISNCANITLNLSEGRHNITVSARDLAGNESNSSLRNFTIDLTGPTITIGYPAEGQNISHNETIELNFSISDNFGFNASSCRYYLDGNTTGIAISDCANTTFNTTDGRHNISISVWDAVGNRGNSSLVNFTVDLFAPTVAIQYPTENLSININESIPLNFTVSDYTTNTSTCIYSLDGGVPVALSNCANATFNVSSNVEGPHNISVSANDSFGRRGNSSVINFTIDKTKPYFNSTWSPENAYTSTNRLQTFTFMVFDNFSATLSCSLFVSGSAVSTDSAVANATTRNLEHYFLLIGSQPWVITCTDAAGNSNSTETRSILINSIPDSGGEHRTPPEPEVPPEEQPADEGQDQDGSQPSEEIVQPPEEEIVPPVEEVEIVAVVEEPPNFDKENAKLAIEAAQAVLSRLESEGKDTTAARKLLEEAQDAFDKGDYKDVEKFANEARDTAMKGNIPASATGNNQASTQVGLLSRLQQFLFGSSSIAWVLPALVVIGIALVVYYYYTRLKAGKK